MVAHNAVGLRTTLLVRVVEEGLGEGLLQCF